MTIVRIHGYGDQEVPQLSVGDMQVGLTRQKSFLSNLPDFTKLLDSLSTPTLKLDFDFEQISVDDSTNLCSTPTGLTQKLLQSVEAASKAKTKSADDVKQDVVDQSLHEPLSLDLSSEPSLYASESQFLKNITLVDATTYDSSVLNKNSSNSLSSSTSLNIKQEVLSPGSVKNEQTMGLNTNEFTCQENLIVKAEVVEDMDGEEYSMTKLFSKIHRCCQEKNIPKNPDLWTPSQVQSWASWTSLEYGHYDNQSLDSLMMNGNQLCALNVQDFIQKVQNEQIGQLLHVELELWRYAFNLEMQTTQQSSNQTMQVVNNELVPNCKIKEESGQLEYTDLSNAVPMTSSYMMSTLPSMIQTAPVAMTLPSPTSSIKSETSSFTISTIPAPTSTQILTYSSNSDMTLNALNAIPQSPQGNFLNSSISNQQHMMNRYNQQLQQTNQQYDVNCYNNTTSSSHHQATQPSPTQQYHQPYIPLQQVNQFSNVYQINEDAVVGSQQQQLTSAQQQYLWGSSAVTDDDSCSDDGTSSMFNRNIIGCVSMADDDSRASTPSTYNSGRQSSVSPNTQSNNNNYYKINKNNKPRGRIGGAVGHTKHTIHLWQFLKNLLLEPQKYSNCIRWVDEQKGSFKIEDSSRVARLWGDKKNRPAMNYDKLSRSIRQYYKKGIIKKTEQSKRLVYQFCEPYL